MGEVVWPDGYRDTDQYEAGILRQAAAILDRRYRGGRLTRRTILSAAASGILEKTAHLLETGRE